MIRHAFLQTASIGGLAEAMTFSTLESALVDSSGMTDGFLARLASTCLRAVDLAPIAVAAGSDVKSAALALDEAVGFVVVHALGGAKG